MDAAFALEVLDKAPYVTVSFTRPDGTPYGLHLSLARTDERTPSARLGEHLSHFGQIVAYEEHSVVSSKMTNAAILSTV